VIAVSTPSIPPTSGATDVEVLERAAQEGRVVVTLDDRSVRVKMLPLVR
jgi:predicted nuclease of predicted toxin-antitoxin system